MEGGSLIATLALAPQVAPVSPGDGLGDEEADPCACSLVTIGAARVGGRTRITVTDTGAGLSQEHISRMFKPFVQVHEGEVVNRGTGLGLFISRGITEQHGGKIWCESPGLGRGAQFIVEFPVDGGLANVSAPVSAAA